MSLFTAIALTVIFKYLDFSTAWTVWCWIAYGVCVIAKAYENYNK